jgi:hypothetical protein
MITNPVFRAARNVGATVGGILSFFGVVPAAYAGGFAGLHLLRILMGHPVPATPLTQSVIVGFVVMGVVCLAFLGIVLGSIFGTGIGVILSLLKSTPDEEMLSVPEEPRIVSSIREAEGYTA